MLRASPSPLLVQPSIPAIVRSRATPHSDASSALQGWRSLRVVSERTLSSLPMSPKRRKRRSAVGKCYDDGQSSEQSEFEELLGEQVRIAERYTRAVAPTTPGVYRLVSDMAQYVDNRGFPSDSQDAARILAKRLNPALRQSSTQR